MVRAGVDVVALVPRCDVRARGERPWEATGLERPAGHQRVAVVITPGGERMGVHLAPAASRKDREQIGLGDRPSHCNKHKREDCHQSGAGTDSHENLSSGLAFLSESEMKRPAAELSHR